MQLSGKWTWKVSKQLLSGIAHSVSNARFVGSQNDFPVDLPGNNRDSEVKGPGLPYGQCAKTYRHEPPVMSTLLLGEFEMEVRAQA